MATVPPSHAWGSANEVRTSQSPLEMNSLFDTPEESTSKDNLGDGHQIDGQLMQIFCRVSAVLSDAIVQTLPPDKQEFFFKLLQESDIRCEVVLLQSGQYAINGDLSSMIGIEKALKRHWNGGLTEDDHENASKLNVKKTVVETEDKAVDCQLLQAGRLRARPGRGFYAEMMGMEVDDSQEEAVMEKPKRGRGRPRKSVPSKSPPSPNGVIEENILHLNKEDSKENVSEKTSDQTLEEHTYVYRKDNDKLTPFKFFCKRCSFKTRRQSHFAKHLSAHRKYAASNLFKCSMCDFTALRKVHVRRHELKHRDESELMHCSHCSFTTFNHFHLNKHIKLKHESQPKKEYACTQCTYTTKFSSHYERHLQAHSGLIPFDVHNHIGDQGGELDESARDLLNFYTDNTFQCKQCSYVSTRKEHFIRHLKNVHTNRRPFLCDLCGKAFKRPDALNQHKLTHINRDDRKYRFPCPTCHKLFKSQAHLKEHVVMHTNVRAFLCEICGANFKTKAVQRKHMQNIHSNPRSHPCPLCDKRFNTKYSLERHQRTHDTPGMRSIVEKGSEQQYSKVVVGNVMVELPTPQDTVPQVVEIHAPIMHQASGDKLEETFHTADAETIQQAYIQTTEASTALLYLTSNFQPY